MKLRATLAVTGLVLLAALAWLIVGERFAGARSSMMLRPDDATLLAQGQQIYVTLCVACHGARLEGQPNWRERGPDGRLPAPPHDATGHTWHHPDEVLIRITRQGVAKAAGLKDYVSAMPAYEDVLGDEEIVAVLSWIKSQWPAEIRAKHDQINQQALARTP
jgi:S-disulfanyl-L-cysteine oxidoreductase SoxD